MRSLLPTTMRKRFITTAVFMATAASSIYARVPLSITCEAKGGTAQIRLVGDITNYQNSADEFEAKVDGFIAAGVRDVHVYIRTNGGDVFQANEIVNVIRRFPGSLTGSGGAKVASAGTMIAMQLDDFRMASNGLFMYHKPSAMLEGNEDGVKGSLKALQDLTAQYRTAYAKKTGLSESEIEKRWSKSDVWLTAKEAMDQKFISGIIEAEAIAQEDIERMVAMGAPKDKLKIAASAAPVSKHESTMDIKAMRVQLGMPETATEQDVLAKVKSLQDAQAKAESVAKEAKAATVKSLIDAAIKERKITEEYREGFLAKFETNFDAAKKELDTIKPVAQFGKATTPAGTPAITNVKGREEWDFDKWMEKDGKGLNAMMTEDAEKFTALYVDKYGKEPVLPKA